MYFSLIPEKTAQTPWGIKIRMDPSNFVERRLVYGEFESEVIDYFQNELVNGTSTFLDIGANIGFYSILFAMESEESEVHAFEPLQKNVARMKHNIGLNDVTSIQLHEFALSDEDGTADLKVSDGNLGETSIISNPVSSESNRLVETDTKRLDALAIETPDLVKIDVEGAEYQVLEGGRECLSEHKPEILLELHPHRMVNPDKRIRDIQTILQNSGYSDVKLVESNEKISVKKLKTVEIDRSIHLHIA
jgi:FkbM family methyltransferase